MADAGCARRGANAPKSPPGALHSTAGSSPSDRFVGDEVRFAALTRPLAFLLTSLLATTAKPLPKLSLVMASFRSLFLALLVAVFAVGVLAEDPPKEQARVDVASRSTLNDATALANKNTLATDNNIMMTRSNAVMQQNDVLDIAEAAQGVAGQPPSGVSLTGEQEALASPEGAPHEMFYGYRHRFYYPYMYGGYYGWRYPYNYWRYYGPRYYGGYCPFGRLYGGYYYC